MAMGQRLVAAAALGLLFAIASSHGVARARDLDADPSNLVQMIDALAPGDVLHLASGSYAHFTLSGLVGSEAQPIVISGPADRSAVIRADEGPCCNTIQIDGNVSHVVLRNLTIDGHGVDGAFGVDARGPDVHHVTIEGCELIGHDAQQQTVAISTKTPTAGWVIRANRIIGAGTGMYLGNSNGEHAFAQAIIEHNLIRDTIGYNIEIKWQLPHAAVPGARPGPGATVIRHNVFIKTDRPSDDGDRPNLLVGGFPADGEGSEDPICCTDPPLLMRNEMSETLRPIGHACTASAASIGPLVRQRDPCRAHHVGPSPAVHTGYSKCT